VPRTGLVYDERCLAHRNPAGGRPFGTFPAWAGAEPFERPERMALTWQVLQGSGVLEHVTRLDARAATEDELRLAHTAVYVARVEAAFAAPEPVHVGDEAWTVPGSREPAMLAAGGLLAAVDAVLAGTLDNAFVVLRPPGHHAESGAGMGFCLFNNTAVAARWAQRERGVGRVAIVDWDVHHGNGTEEVFRDDGSVLTVSLHQAALYPPDTGGLDSGGEANVNVPLPAGTGDDGYALAFDAVVAPAVRAFAPELVIVGAGQDASASDPLGRMAVTVPGFRALADRVMALAAEVCGGRLVAMLEGGYSLQHLPLANLAILEGLAGLAPSFTEDPVGCDVPLALRPEERAAVAAAVERYRP
jgi:acetoin utilization deacetylase AcuC-like enzyme